MSGPFPNSSTRAEHPKLRALPSELASAVGGLFKLDPDAGLGVVILHDGLRTDDPSTPAIWTQPFADCLLVDWAAPSTYAEADGCSLFIWGRFEFGEERILFQFVSGGKACGLEIAVKGEVCVTGNPWRDAPPVLRTVTPTTIREIVQWSVTSAEKNPASEPTASSNGSKGSTSATTVETMVEAAQPADEVAVEPVNGLAVEPVAEGPKIPVRAPDTTGTAEPETRAGTGPQEQGRVIAADTTAIAHHLDLYREPLDADDDAQLALFALPITRGFASRNRDEIVEQAARWIQARLNVYLHVHLHRNLPDGESSRRGSLDTVHVAIGVWADIDCCGPGRKKLAEVLCPTVADAVWIAEEFDRRYQPLALSLFQSGYGVYPMLRFKKPLVIQTSSERTLLENYSRRFHNALHRIASQRGWTGAVEYADPSKILRLPGSFNFKDNDHPRLVEVLYERQNGFTLDELDDVLPPPDRLFKQRLRAVKTLNTGSLILDPNANPPQDIFELLAEAEPRFLSSWNHRRHDGTDTSQSGFDLSMANYMARADLNDQDIVNTLIANRRLHGGEPKLREDYYAGTIRRARESAEKWWAKSIPALNGGSEESNHSAERHKSEERPASGASNATDHASTAAANPIGPPPADSLAADPTPSSSTITGDGGIPGDGDGQPPHTDPTDHSVLLKLLSEYLGVPILGIKKYKSDPHSMYEIVTALGAAKLADISDLIEQNRLRRRIADVTGILFTRYKAAKWHEIAQILLKVRQEDDLGPDATEGGAIRAWLSQYLEERPIHNGPEAADAGKEPFRLNGEIFIFLDNLRSWLRLRKSEKLSPNELATILRRSGAQNVPSLDVTINNKKTTRGVWKVPPGL